MVTSMKSVLAVAVVASVVCSTFALQCYHCDSTRDPKCGEKFDSEDNFKVDCARLQQQLPQSVSQFGPFYIANATGCVKKFLDYLPGQPRIKRTCFYGDMSRTTVGCNTDSNERVLRCEVCTGEFCNSASGIVPIGLAITLYCGLARLLA